MKNHMRIYAALFFLLSATGCSTSNLTSGNNSEVTQSINSIKSQTSLSGTVQFPSSFSTKASLSDVATSATVSLIYPSDHATNANKTIATGLTAANGSFSINPSATFSPATNEVFTLEASKRSGGAGNDAIALRTIVKWNGTSFDSITLPSIYINAKTTALSIISNLSPGDIASSATIGQMATAGGLSVVANINSTVTEALINSVKTLVETQLAANIDPVSSIEKNGANYQVHSNAIPNSPTFTTGCVGEPSTCP